MTSQYNPPNIGPHDESVAAVVEGVANAIEAARCRGREGPFGGYDYGYPDGKPVEGGRYVIRDFRDPRSPDWGMWLHQTDDRRKHEAMLAQMTREHIACAAISAMPTPSQSALIAQLVEVCERILDRGYVSQSIEEERDDHNALVAALAAARGEG